MASPEETYRAAILRACEAHLVCVKAARDTRDSHLNGERLWPARTYEKAVGSSEAQRAKDGAIALATFKATVEVLGTT